MKYMTAQWYMMCQEHPKSEKVDRAIREATDAYHQQYVKSFASREPDFGKARLHDSIVLSCMQEGSDLVMDLEPDLTDITRLVFKDCEVMNLGFFIGSKKLRFAVKRAAKFIESEPLKDAW